MSHKAEKWAWEQRIPSSEKMVLLKLAYHADPTTGDAYPGVKNIASSTGFSERQVQRCLKSLVTRGAVAIVGNEEGGRGKTRTYQFVFEKGDAHDITGAANSDANNTLLNEERVTPETTKGDTNDAEINSQRVTSEDTKGDIPDVKGDTFTRAIPEPPVKNRQEEPSVTRMHPKPNRRKKRDDLTNEQQDRFDRWYDVYPKKIAAARAEKAWAAIDPDDEMTEHMIAKVREWADSWEWTKQGRQFCPHPASWLNSKQWRDGPPSEQPFDPTLTVHYGGNAPPQENTWDALRRERGINVESSDTPDAIETKGRLSS